MPEHLPSHAAAGLSWMATAAKLPALRHHDPAARAFGWVLVLLSLGLSLRLPPVAAHVGRFSGLPHLAWLLGAYLLMAACLSAHAFLLLLEGAGPHARRIIRRRGLALATTCVVMALLFSATPTDRQHGDFLELAAADRAAAACALVHLAVLGSGMGWMARALWRHAACASEATLRGSLTLMILGLALGLVAILHLTVWLTLRPLKGFPFSWDPHLVSRAVGSSAVAGYLLGATLPAWLRPLVRTVGRYRAHRRLARLWRALSRTNPHIPVLAGRAGLAGILHPCGLELRLYRRVIEIRYGLLALRPPLDPGHAGTEHRRDGHEVQRSDDRAAMAEALALTVALRASAERRVSAESTPSRSGPAPGGADLESDAAYLLKVARHWRRAAARRRVSGTGAP